MMDDISDSDSDDEPPMLVDMSIASEDPDLIAEAPLPTTEITTEAATATATIATNHPQPLQVLPPCPVTILSGFLGSGKTTLIQHILKDPNHGKRIAVIENEFGDGLDIESLIAKDGMEDNDDGDGDNKNNALQDLIELPNGCLCCTVKDTLVVTLENLVTQKRQDLDYILIEASGMANPGPIASVFWLDDAMESRLQLDGIVTVVDSHHILEQLKETEEAAQQIAYADRLLLNKIDLLSSSSEQQKQQALQDVKDAMRRLHPTAEMQTTTYSRIPDLDWILNANCFGGSERVEELDRVWNQAARQQSLQSSLFSQNHNSGSDEAIFCGICQEDPAPTIQHKHTAKVATLAFQHNGSVDLARFNRWLANLLWPNQDAEDKVLTAMLYNNNNKTTHLPKPDGLMQIFRIKGILSVRLGKDDDDEDDGESKRYRDGTTGLDRRRYIVQAVHDLWEVHPASDALQWDDSKEQREGKLVVIGKFLDKSVLEQGFTNCFV